MNGMGRHSVKFWIEPDEIRGEIVCNADPGKSICRVLPCPHGCDEYAVEMRPDGTFFHAVYEDEDNLHEVTPDMDPASSACGVLPWFDRESVEFYYGGDTATVRDGDVKFSWNGGGYYTWQYQ